MVTFLAFFAVHMIMVASTHLSRNLNAITLDQNKYNLNGVVLTLLATRSLIGLNVWAVRFSWTHTRVLQKISNMTVGRVMDLLFDHYGPRAEYREKDISPYFWPNGLVPTGDDWTRLKRRGVPRLPRQSPRPGRASGRAVAGGPAGDGPPRPDHDAQLHPRVVGDRQMVSGCPSPSLIDAGQTVPRGEVGDVDSYGEGGEGGPYYDSHSIEDLHHNQSLLAYEMNGEPLPVLHGAPLRLRVENQLGFKQVKWIREIEFVRHFSERGDSQGGYNEDHEFYGYRDEI